MREIFTEINIVDRSPARRLMPYDGSAPMKLARCEKCASAIRRVFPMNRQRLLDCRPFPHNPKIFVSGMGLISYLTIGERGWNDMAEVGTSRIKDHSGEASLCSAIFPCLSIRHSGPQVAHGIWTLECVLEWRRTHSIRGAPVVKR